MKCWGQTKDFAMLLRGMDRRGRRINVMLPPVNFTPAQMRLYDEVAAAQNDVLADGLNTGAALYAGQEVANG